MRLLIRTASIGVAGALACNKVDLPPSPPANVCPDNPCAAYAQGGSTPVCTAGACLVTAPVPGLAIVVTLPVASAFAPGSTFAVAYEHLFDNQIPRLASGRPPKAALPALGGVQGAYLIAPKAAADDVGFPLGNTTAQGASGPPYTALPVAATYRLLWPKGSGEVPADTLRLPVEPVQATPVAGNPRYPGPGGGASIAFRAVLQPGRYQLVLRPTPPFDRIFGPLVTAVSIATGDTADLEFVEGFDVTRETGKGPTIPTFDIGRVAGLDGWTTYLRDASGLVVSNIAPLAGTESHVLLATRRVTPDVDALTGAVLVIAPPPGQPYPTGLFAPIGNALPATETYPTLPAPALVQGNIEAEDGTPVAADLVFQAVAITDDSGMLNATNFEFVARAQARPDPRLGTSSYSVELPQGSYRVSVRPLDQARQLTTVPFEIGAHPGSRDVVTAPLRTVAARAFVADGRPLVGAVVDADPLACADSESSPWCQPRQATTVTLGDGSFQLALDPGQYWLRVRPAEGTRLPWAVQRLSVGPADRSVTLGSIVVPAPVSAGLTLVDPGGNPLARAIVRLFSIPPPGSSAIEIGRSVTQSDGSFEMYIQPPAR